MTRLISWLLGITLGCLVISPAFAQGDPPAPPTTGAMTPAMRQQMMAMMQDMMVMMQNTAVWTPQGLVVLQGNRLLAYTPDLKLAHTVALPVPPAPAMPMATPATPGAMAMPTMPSLRSQVSAKLIPTDDGLLVVRGQQVLRFDRNFKLVSQVMLPDLPPLTASETAAVCPMCMQMMMMMGGGMPMGGAAGMPMNMPM